MTKNKAEFLTFILFLGYFLASIFIGAMLVIYVARDIFYSIDHLGLRYLFLIVGMVIGLLVYKLIGETIIEGIAAKLHQRVDS